MLFHWFYFATAGAIHQAYVAQPSMGVSSLLLVSCICWMAFWAHFSPWPLYLWDGERLGCLAEALAFLLVQSRPFDLLVFPFWSISGPRPKRKTFCFQVVWATEFLSPWHVLSRLFPGGFQPFPLYSCFCFVVFFWCVCLVGYWAPENGKAKCTIK